MQGRNLLIAAVAVILGLVAVVVANAWFSGKEDQQDRAIVDTRTTQIVVATQPFEFGTKLTQQNIKLQDWPNASIPQGAFRTLAEALRENRVALRPIVPGEPILADKVSGKDGRATLAALLPEGMRATSVPVDAVRGVAGFILPGTMVDVLLTRNIPGEGTISEDIRSDVLLTNVQVLAIDQVASDRTDKPKVSRTATLAVTLYDAQRLALATKMGTLSLVLRKVETAAGSGTDDGTAAPEMAATTVTGRQIGGPRLYVVRRRGGDGGGGGGGGSAPAPRAPTFAAPPAGAAVMPAAPSGPTMTVFRGAEPTVYPVGRLGGR
jgi:pilus assembly protein CpaB